MTGKTHLLAGTLVGLALSSALHVQGTGETLALVAASAIGGVFPDIDEPSSKIGRRVPVAPYLLKFTFGHRGITHGIPTYALLYTVCMLGISKYTECIQAFMCGVASHIFLDMFNESGVPLFWPIKKRFSIAKIPLGGILEGAFTAAFAAGVLWFGKNLIT